MARRASAAEELLSAWEEVHPLYLPCARVGTWPYFGLSGRIAPAQGTDGDLTINNLGITRAKA